MRKVTTLLLLLYSGIASGQSLDTFINKVDATITNQTGKATISPAVVGTRIVELAGYVQGASDSAGASVKKRDTTASGYVETKAQGRAYARSLISPTWTDAYLRSLTDIRWVPPYSLRVTQQDGTVQNIDITGFALATETGASLATLNGLISQEILTALHKSDTVTKVVTPAQLNTGLAGKLNASDTTGPVATNAELNTIVVTKLNYTDTVARVVTPAQLNTAQAGKLNFSDTITKVVTPAQLAAAIPTAQSLTNYRIWDSTLQNTAPRGAFPWEPGMTIMSNRGVRNSILATECTDTTVQLYLWGIGHLFNYTGSLYRSYLQFGSVANPGTIYAGGWNTNGFKTVTAASDSIEIVPLYRVSDGAFIGYQPIDWRQYPTGANRLQNITYTTSKLSKEVSRKRDIINSRANYAQGYFDKGVFANYATVNTLFPDLINIIEKLDFTGPSTTEQLYISKLGIKSGITAPYDSIYIAFRRMGYSTSNAQGDVSIVAALTASDTTSEYTTLTMTQKYVPSGLSGKITLRLKRTPAIGPFGTISYSWDSTIAPIKSGFITLSPAPAYASPAWDRLLAPKELFFVKGRKMPIYQDNVFSSDSITRSGNRRFRMLAMSNKLKIPVPYAGLTPVLDPADFGNADTLLIMATYYSNDSGYYRYAKLNVADSAAIRGKAAKVCMTGNSIWIQGVVDTVIGRCRNDFGITVTPVGTVGNTNIKSEARSSLSLYNLVGRQTSYGADENGSGSNWRMDSTLYASGGSPRESIPTIRVCPLETVLTVQDSQWTYQYTPSITGGATGKNREESLYEAVRSGSHATFIGAGGKYTTFRPDRWFSSTESTGLSDTSNLIVIIGDLFNDINHGISTGNGDTGLYDGLEAMRCMITRLNNWKSGITLGVCPMTVVNRTNQWGQFAKAIERSIALVDSFAVLPTYNVSIIPTYMHVERTTAFNFLTATQADALTNQNDTKKGRGGDAIHPVAWSGRKEISNSIAYWIANKAR